MLKLFRIRHVVGVLGFAVFVGAFLLSLGICLLFSSLTPGCGEDTSPLNTSESSLQLVKCNDLWELKCYEEAKRLYHLGCSFHKPGDHLLTMREAATECVKVVKLARQVGCMTEVEQAFSCLDQVTREDCQTGGICFLEAVALDRCLY